MQFLLTSIQQDLPGDCIMPKEGVFGKVLREGAIRIGDPIAFI
jgi:MOSC domain-containing protein YiiM